MREEQSIFHLFFTSLVSIFWKICSLSSSQCPDQTIKKVGNLHFLFLHLIIFWLILYNVVLYFQEVLYYISYLINKYKLNVYYGLYAYVVKIGNILHIIVYFYIKVKFVFLDNFYVYYFMIENIFRLISFAYAREKVWIF